LPFPRRRCWPNPYDDYAGTTLVVNFPAHPHYDAVMQILPEFTKETGIEVEVDQLPYLKMRERQTLELAQDEGDYDLIAYVVFSKADYVYADQLENLAKYFMNPRLADPNYDAHDLIDGYVYNIGFAGGDKGYLEGPTGSLFGIPYGSETSILATARTSSKSTGWKCPRPTTNCSSWPARSPNWSRAWAAVAAARPRATTPAMRSCCTWRRWAGIFDDQWNPIVNNEAGVSRGQRAENDCRLRTRRAASFGFGEALGSFLNGDTAMFLDTTVVAGQIDDPSKSRSSARSAGRCTRWACAAASQTGGFGIGIPPTPRTRKPRSC
jgi:multiple sugar transport system substrate-binding protein